MPAFMSSLTTTAVVEEPKAAQTRITPGTTYVAYDVSTRMAPPNRYTNISISITGSISDVISASALRRDSRRARPISVIASRTVAAGRVCGVGQAG
jgi:hypothetical protein